MPDICFNCEQKKTYLQFLRHLIFQFGIVCLCFLTASHKVSGLILLDDGSSYSFMSIMIFFFAKSFKMHSAVGMQQNRQAYIHTTQYIQQNCFLAAALLCPAARQRRRRGVLCNSFSRLEAATTAAAAYRCRLECATYIYAQAAKFILHLERQYGREVQQQCYH